MANFTVAFYFIYSISNKITINKEGHQMVYDIFK